jgi:hypothetical protein
MITPAGVLLLPIAIGSIYRRSWAFTLFLVSVPFRALDLLYAISHEFPFPEIALIALLVSHLLHVWRERGVLLPVTLSIYLLGGFVVVCVLSIVSLLINPLDAMTHAFNSGPHGKFVLSPIKFSLTNVTQFVLRVFAVGAIIGLATVLFQYDVHRVLQFLIISSLFIVGFGFFYQLTQAFNATEIWEFTQTLGLDMRSNSGTQIVPRMWTPIGEPGQTASYFVYFFAFTATLSILPETRVMSRTRVRIISVLLLITLLLSTSTTAYGGLLIFAVVFFITALASKQISTRLVLVLYTTGAIGVVVIVAIASGTTNPNIIPAIESQVAKLQFRAGSGVIRLRYLTLAFDLFTQRPVLGTGVGSFFGTSVLGTILAETGIAGILMFVAANVSAHWECLRAAYDQPNGDSFVAIALVVAGVVLVGSSLLAKSINTLVYPWFWLSLALPIALSVQSERRLVSIQDISRYYSKNNQIISKLVSR